MSFSIWEQEAFFGEQDLVIAGAGLLGLWTALACRERYPRMRITVLERHSLPIGASTRNAGFACYGSPSELLYDADRSGTDNMLSVVEMRFRGIERLRRFFEGTDIGYDACGGYEVYLNNATLHRVREELGRLNSLLKPITGRAHTFQWATAGLDAFGMAGFADMVQNTDEAALHSGRLVKALAGAVTQRGIQILYNCPVTRWEPQGTAVHVHTPLHVFKTGHLLLATNAFTRELCSEAAIQPGRGQIVVTEPVPGLRLHGTFHFDEGFYYFRNLGNRILLGGARNADMDTEHTTAFGTTEKIQSILEQFIARHLLPGQPVNISHRWSGIMGFTESKLPEAQPLAERVTAITACNGMGVALSPVFAEKLASMY